MIYTVEQARKYRECDEGDCPTIRHFREVVWGLFRNLKGPARVLDVGCGTGRYFLCVPPHHALYGLDPSREMLKEAENPMGGRSASYLWRGCVEELDSPTKFDVIYSIGTLAEHTPLTAEIIATLYHYLSPRGLLYFTAEKLKDGKPTTITTLGLADIMAASSFSKYDYTEWNTDTEHFKGTHFEVIAE